eukprot:m.130848 g.130848  ORF g.130848 m.130848 type:complete len:377 (+) comp16802_c0_seq8:1028-2158(+)
MKTKYHWFLAGLMLLTGSINTIVTKYADLQCGYGVADYPRDQSPHDNPCKGRAKGEHPFDHPFAQALAMFIGEFTCLLAFKLAVLNARRQNKPPPFEAGKQSWNPLIFLLPACCDCTATSAMYVGLTLTYASQFQMLRGSVVIFTGLLSRFWLKRQLLKHHWCGMLLVLSGLVFVGLASELEGGSSDASAPNPLLGNIIIVCAQVIVALQMVVEEKFVGKYDVPALQAVGWEGVFGMGIMSTLCLIFYEVPGPRAGGKFENFNDAVEQFVNTPAITVAICGTIASIAFFNFSGISVTKEMSATTRMVLDSVRTFVIWGFGLIVGWEQFAYMQIIGFVLLLLGTFVYNDILVVPIMRKIGMLKPKPSEKESLIQSTD